MMRLFCASWRRRPEFSSATTSEQCQQQWPRSWHMAHKPGGAPRHSSKCADPREGRGADSDQGVRAEFVGCLPDLLPNVEHMRWHLSEQCLEVGIPPDSRLHEHGMDSPRQGVVRRNESGSIYRGVQTAPVCSSDTSDHKRQVWFDAVLLHPRVELVNAFDGREEGGQMPFVEFSKRPFELCRSVSQRSNYEIGDYNNQGGLPVAASWKIFHVWRGCCCQQISESG